MIFLFYDSFCFNFFRNNILSSNLKYKVLIRISLDKFSISINDTDIKFFNEKIQYSKNNILNLFLYPFHLIGIFLYIFSIIKKIKEKKVVEYVYLEGFIIFLSGLITIKLLRLKNVKLIYFCGDWFEPKNSLLSKIFCKLFYASDKIILKNEHKSFYFSELLKKKRSDHNNINLKGEILPVLYDLNNSSNEKNKRDIAIIGNFKIHIELYNFIKNYNNYLYSNNIKIHLFGPSSKNKVFFLNQLKKDKLNNLIIDHGFFDRKKLNENLKSCIIGLNLITSDDVYSKNSINARTVDYISNFLIPITNIQNTTTSNFLISNKLGYIIKNNSPKSIFEAILFIRCNYSLYHESNLVLYSKIKSYNFLNV